MIKNIQSFRKLNLIATNLKKFSTFNVSIEVILINVYYKQNHLKNTIYNIILTEFKQATYVDSAHN